MESTLSKSTLHTHRCMRRTPFNRLFAGVYTIALFALLYHHAFRMRPIHRQQFPENLEKVVDRKDFPAMDIFICTADPYKEPPMTVVNTTLSVMAYDYPTEKLSVYVSDDGGSELTLFALMEAAKFGKHWLPYCRQNNIVDRCPEAYFRSNHPRSSEIDKIKCFLSVCTVYITCITKEKERQGRRISQVSSRSSSPPGGRTEVIIHDRVLLPDLKELIQDCNAVTIVEMAPCMEEGRPCVARLSGSGLGSFRMRDDDSYEMCRAYVLPNLRDSVERTYPILPESFQTRREQHPGPIHGRGSGESDLCDASISGDDRVELRAVRCQSGNDRLGVRGAIKIGDNTLRRASYEAIFSLSRALGKTVLSGWKTNIGPGCCSLLV
ncbi:unnamed protein product [Ilex paraguariensis]|uniref:Uncharacterized protein n=2 Tax=Ilex paraguariensis TaxID=185542 RepID=A0ABC8UZ63_9AQUA